MKHRSALIAAASIAAVVFGGAIAVGANLGILTVADSSPVGQLSAANAATKAAPAQTGVLKPVAAPAATPKASSQEYLIKQAGSVKVAFGKKSVRLVHVSAKRHWTWTLAQTRDKKLTVTFKHGSSTYTFVAAVSRQGKLTAKVDHPVTKVITTASTGGSVSWTATPVAAPASPAHQGGDEQDNGGGNSHEGGGADD
jgi:hypothetical protein